MTKKLGIDLGSSSLGWFIREGDQIINNGVVAFATGMKLGTGGYSSPTKDRREARSKRRLIQARKYRKWELLKILIEHDYVPLSKEEFENWSKYKKGTTKKFPESKNFQKWLACDFIYQGEIKYKNPYELRVKALDKKLTKHEIGRALYHIVQRRGYKDIGERDNETKTQIERRGDSGFKEAMKNNRTIAEALKNDFSDNDKRARNEYPYRAEYETELISILKAQGFDTSQNEKKEYNDIFVKKTRKAIIWQRPLRSQKGNIGKCALETTKNRCPASHPIFEIFRTWQYINTIKYIDNKGKKQFIPIEYKKDIFNEVFLKKDKNFKFEVIQKRLDKLFKEKKIYNYLNKSTKKYDSTVSGMPVCKGIIRFFGEDVKKELKELHNYNIGTKEHNIYGNYSIYDIWHILYEFDNDHLQDFAEKKLGIASIDKEHKNGEPYKENPLVKYKQANFSTSFSDLSLKAMCKIIPFLQEGFLYNEAVLLAKIPDVYKAWGNNKDLIYKLIENANTKYANNKTIIGIANNLINKYKALGYNEEIGISEKFAHKDYSYQLADSDFKDIEKTCISTFGKKTWEEKENKEDTIKQVSEYYQTFFSDEKRKYIELPTLSTLIENEFKENGIEIDGEKLYHHSDRKNLYLAKLPVDKETGKHILPTDKKTGIKILPIPLIDSIKNPMFNKSMSVLRKLINELIVQEYVDEDGVIRSYIDEDTEIIVEVARELNDNNKRIAIERYQRERESNRVKYREFINELKGENKKNEEDNIAKLEIWAEQIFAEPIDDKSVNKNHEILKEKNAEKRYELWSEQKGQCMYTGKMIGISQLFTSDIEIEHTIPRSLLPDNTKANLTVCFSKYNNDIKNNRIPTACPNYEKDTDEGTAISPRLKKWEKIRDNFKKQYNDRTKPFGNEDEAKKNKRIQEKHYFRMHFEYWKDKVDRFTTEEIKDSWVRRQLTDTQMVSKYAREFLKTYFKKVVVQKGSTTADYRKIFGFQPEDEIKNRNKHTHHSIDAAVLTLIPTNSSKRVNLLNKMYKMQESRQGQFTTKPDGFPKFNAQKIINFINNNTLIVNYQKDKITDQTYRNVRKRGKLQYLKKDGKYVLDEKGDKILLKAKGASIRGDLFQQTYIGKIKNVERDENGKPIRNDDNSWKYQTGKDEFENVVRKPITEAKVEDIVDPDIKKLIEEQLSNGISKSKLKDHQGNIIRHIRVKTKAARTVKKRVNYKSKHEYKNSYYSAAGEIPYAIFLTKRNNKAPETPEHKMIPIPIHEVAQTFKDFHKFTPELYLQKFHPEIKEYQDLKLLKVGQKVFVLKEDSDYEKRKDVTFQMNRMYRIIQFSEGNIWLKYHLEAREKTDIMNGVKDIKSSIVLCTENEFNLPKIMEDTNIDDKKKRKKDFEDKMFKFSSLKDYRLNRLVETIGENNTKKLKEKLDKHKAFSSIVELEGETPLLKTSKNNWNFLIENYDFTINITGKIEW